jgi:hypothetical protein
VHILCSQRDSATHKFRIRFQGHLSGSFRLNGESIDSMAQACFHWC